MPKHALLLVLFLRNKCFTTISFRGTKVLNCSVLLCGRLGPELIEIFYLQVMIHGAGYDSRLDSTSTNSGPILSNSSYAMYEDIFLYCK